MKKILLGMVAVLSVSFLSTSVFALGKNKQLPADAMIVSASSQVQAINVSPFATGIIALNPIDPAQLGIDEAKLKNMKPEDAQKYIQEKMDAYAKIHFGTGIQAVTVTATAGFIDSSATAIASGNLMVLPANIDNSSIVITGSTLGASSSGVIMVQVGDVKPETLSPVKNTSSKKIKKNRYNRAH